MPRKSFDRELQDLQDEVLNLAGVVEKAIVDSVQTLQERDVEASRRLIAEDLVINEKRYEIEAGALTLIATQQPMAGDLRTIFTVLEIATELERMADYAKGIAKINVLIGDEPLLEPFAQIPRMAEKAREMLHRALEAFERRDAALARRVCAKDDEMDALHNRIYLELLTVTTTDSATVDQATQLLWVVHNLERVADRAVNICERVVFTVSGELVELDGDEGVEAGMAGVL
jgi:phosphate transport system protein